MLDTDSNQSVDWVTDPYPSHGGVGQGILVTKCKWVM